jgi:hypothetical protein
MKQRGEAEGVKVLIIFEDGFNAKEKVRYRTNGYIYTCKDGQQSLHRIFIAFRYTSSSIALAALFHAAVNVDDI